MVILQRDFNSKETIIFLKKHNPSVDIQFRKDNHSGYTIFVNCNPYELKLPNGWYIDKNEYLTNQYHSSHGAYSRIKIIINF